MSIPIGTKVLWETESPHGRYFPSVLNEGKVCQPVDGQSECFIRGFTYVTDSPNALVYVRQCKLVLTRLLVY